MIKMSEDHKRERMQEIYRWRQKIDDLDEELVRLLNDRAVFADNIGRLKQSLGLEVYSPAREQQVIRNVISSNKGPLNHSAMRRLFERIIDESRKLEREAIIIRDAESPKN